MMDTTKDIEMVKKLVERKNNRYSQKLQSV
jgi:hypothetical protein